ncbi:MAG: hypothetical protein B7Y39_10725 [Bdellovibrio sp. 28-41-41]|nr:MAG: hypothetical protein B7Y39_10725 [Bdellovibrio sp. 28-41-41]
MSFFSRIFEGSVKAALVPIAVAVIPVAAVVFAGLASAKKGNEKVRSELNLDETVVDMCKRNPRLLRCMGASSSTASGMNSGGISGCQVTTEVKKINDEADNVWNRFSILQSGYSSTDNANNFKSCASSQAAGDLRKKMGVVRRATIRCRTDRLAASDDVQKQTQKYEQAVSALKNEPLCADLLAVAENAVSCPAEPFVKEVSAQADTIWSQVLRVNSTVNVTMKGEGSTYDKSSGALPVQIAQNEQCLAALKEPIAKYEALKSKVQESCRNNYDRENEKLLENQNLLAAYKNKMKETPSCGRAAAILGWSRTVADAAAEIKSGSASAVK